MINVKINNNGNSVGSNAKLDVSDFGISASIDLFGIAAENYQHIEGAAKLELTKVLKKQAVESLRELANELEADANK